MEGIDTRTNMPAFTCLRGGVAKRVLHKSKGEETEVLLMNLTETAKKFDSRSSRSSKFIP